MFRRLFLSFGLLLLALLGLLGLLLDALVVRDDLRAGAQLIVCGVAVAGVLGVLGLSAWIARQSTRPLRALMGAAEGVGTEAAGQRVFPESRDEVGELGRVF